MRTLGFKKDRLVEIGEGSGIVAFVRISDAPVTDGESAFGVKSDRLGVISEGAFVIAGLRICIAFADKGSVACSCFGFLSFAFLLRRPQSNHSLLFGFLTLALSFGLGRCSCPALLLCCQALFLRLLHLAVSCRFSRSAIFL